MKIVKIANEIKIIQRKIIRSHRQSNLECFEEDKWEKKDKNWVRKKGKSIKGKRHSNKSNKCKELEKQLVEKRRLLNETKKTLYG
ncbi:MAG: hypothetical protein KJ949_01070, partial [Nanoarchaeota archaeon]|nr:hypothetical protein [Nanoarchaeota archaeon]